MSFVQKKSFVGMEPPNLCILDRVITTQPGKFLKNVLIQINIQWHHFLGKHKNPIHTILLCNIFPLVFRISSKPGHFWRSLFFFDMAIKSPHWIYVFSWNIMFIQTLCWKQKKDIFNYLGLLVLALVTLLFGTLCGPKWPPKEAIIFWFQILSLKKWRFLLWHFLLL